MDFFSLTICCIFHLFLINVDTQTTIVYYRKIKITQFLDSERSEETILFTIISFFMFKPKNSIERNAMIFIFIFASQ